MWWSAVTSQQQTLQISNMVSKLQPAKERTHSLFSHMSSQPLQDSSSDQQQASHYFNINISVEGHSLSLLHKNRFSARKAFQTFRSFSTLHVHLNVSVLLFIRRFCVHISLKTLYFLMWHWTKLTTLKCTNLTFAFGKHWQPYSNWTLDNDVWPVNHWCIYTIKLTWSYTYPKHLVCN